MTCSLLAFLPPFLLLLFRLVLLRLRLLVLVLLVLSFSAPEYLNLPVPLGLSSPGQVHQRISGFVNS